VRPDLATLVRAVSRPSRDPRGSLCETRHKVPEAILTIGPVRV
jgi:hypothetical protein